MGGCAVSDQLAAVGASRQQRRQSVVRLRALGWLPWVAPLVLLVVWEGAAQLGSLSPQVLPAPARWC